MAVLCGIVAHSMGAANQSTLKSLANYIVNYRDWKALFISHEPAHACSQLCDGVFANHRHYYKMVFMDSASGLYFVCGGRWRGPGGFNPVGRRARLISFR